MEINLITGNSGKAAQFAAYLNTPVAHKALDLPEMQTFDIEEIVKHKSVAAYSAINTPVLVEDTALTFHALGKLPGTFIRWFEKELDSQDLIDLLATKEDKSATVTVACGLYDGKTFSYFVGSSHGQIAPEPRGSGGFGWDNIFIPDGYQETRAEMTQSIYETVSVRKAVCQQINDFLLKH